MIWAPPDQILDLPLNTFAWKELEWGFVQSKVLRQNLGSLKCDAYVKHLFLW